MPRKRGREGERERERKRESERERDPLREAELHCLIPGMYRHPGEEMCEDPPCS